MAERYGGWQVVSEHLTAQQRLQMKAEHEARHGDHTDTVHTLEDGWSIKKLKHKQDYTLEGKLMQNCVGGYGPDRGYHDVYSLRDPDDLPYVTFQMRKQDAASAGSTSYWGHGRVNPDPDALSTYEQDNGTDVINTTSVLGRNNEPPKEDYGKHLVQGLSEMAKAQGIPHVKWDGGPARTPEYLDNFLEQDKKPPPAEVYLKVPVGMKTEEGGVDFTGGGGPSSSYRRPHNKIKVSEEEPEAQFGYHVFKTPFSEKRFDKVDDLKNRLNNPDGVSGGWKVKTKPNSTEPNVSGLNKNQAKLVHEARTPDHVYVKMAPGDFEEAKGNCGTCGGTGKEGVDNYYGPACTRCAGTGKGDLFSLKNAGRYRYSGMEATANPGDYDGHDYDNMVVKLPFSEENFSFNEDTGKYHAKTKTYQAHSEDAVSIHKQVDLPEKLYVGVPSKERQNRNVYSEDGLEPVFMKNNNATLHPNRQHFVGAKGNDIIEVDTSKLPQGALMRHSKAASQGDRRAPYGAAETDMWQLNPKMPIPYEAITKPHHEVADAQLIPHLQTEHDLQHTGDADTARQFHERLHKDNFSRAIPEGEPGHGDEFSAEALQGVDHPTRGPREINVVDPSEQNKRKKHVTVQARGIDGKLFVDHPAPEPVESVRFATQMNGRSVEDIKSFEAGNISKGVGVGIPSDSESTPAFQGNSAIRVHIANDPEHVEEITPSIKEIRENGGAVNVGGLSARYDHDNMPKQRYFRLKDDIPAGHPVIKGVDYSEQMQAMRGSRDSIVPDTAYVHVPRRRRGNTDLYGEEGIDLRHVTEKASENDPYGRRGASDLKKAWDKPMEGSRDSLNSGEDPSEMDVWAVDMNKLPKARLSTGSTPYGYGARRPEGETHTSFELHGPCGSCGGEGRVDGQNCATCSGEGTSPHPVVPWDAVRNLHRKPEEPTAPAIRRFFNTASVRAYKNIFLVR